ncbi:MAG: sulfatase-like hydrolase/transferase, partial [Verrucomicrobiae bacterium]|nr:sulfatase-like hydrolase/transferase [Verrucomicrobiae bacterium]
PAAVLPSSTPNILFVVADDIGVDNISAYGEHASSASTPSIDALASDGVLFRNTWANPMCSPSRASLLTGRHAFRHGLLHPAGAELDADEETVAEILQGVGYATALFGKWHLGTSTGTTPADQGYDYFSGALSGNIDDYFSWTKTTQEVIDGVTYQDSSTETGYATSTNVAEAQSWIAQQSSPWLVTLAFNAGHSPYHVPPSDLHTYALSG